MSVSSYFSFYFFRFTLPACIRIEEYMQIFHTRKKREVVTLLFHLFAVAVVRRRSRRRHTNSLCTNF